MVSNGSVQLSKLLEPRGEQHKCAAKLKVAASLLIRWRRGDQSPEGKYRALLEDELGIPWRSWDEPPEVAS